MFERKIEETISSLLRDTIAEQDTITSRQIFASDIPAALKRMFEQDIDLWITEEKDRLFNSPHFRYDEQDVQELFEQIIARAQEYAVFGREEYGQALNKNVKLLFNHVCRPQWTLVKYFFADRENASADAIIDGLKYFHYYEYYRVILSEYFQKKEITVMSAKKFGELLEYIDQEVVRNFDSRKVAHLAEPVFEAFSIGSSVEEKFVPVEALTLFYDDKNLRSIVERLEREKENRESITQHDLVMLISEVDYAMSFDISEIVHEQIHGSSVMKPERKVTAGKDFDVPKIDQSVEPGERRKDIGEEDGDLDFIITDEENSVVAHASDEDSINTVIEQDETDTYIEDDLDVTIEQTEEDEAGSGAESYEDEFAPQDDESDQDVDELDRPDTVQTDEGEYRYSLDEEISVTDEIPDEDEFAGDESDFETGVYDELSLQDDLTEEASSIDLAERMEERDSIPEMSLDDMDELARSMGEESDDDVVLDSEEFDDDMTGDQQEPDTDDEMVPDVSLDDEADAELDIDWEKEAEDVPDVDIDEEEETAVTDDSIPGISLTEDENLKPAEELLSQLDLDDMEEEEKAAPQKSYNDIPIVEDERPPPSPVTADEDAEEGSVPDVPPDEVIAEFGDIKEQISSSDRKKYIKKLFQRNDDAYEHAMRVLNGKPTWREASEYIDELFIKHDVDMYSRIAVKFTDDVYKRYLKKQ